MRTLLISAAIVGAFGCGKVEEDTQETATVDTQSDGLDLDQDGVTEADGDCDDSNPEVYPGRLEDCNGIDDNCNDLADEGFTDTDGDTIADCVDEETCDGIDNDGDGDIDEGYADSDGDGIPDCASEEECDGIDNNGDGQIDEGFDVDGDGVKTCDGDCDDNDSEVFEGATEIPDDGKDNDCDGLIDESLIEEGAIRIVEIMWNPGRTSDPNGEWFEVRNMTEAQINISGMIISSSDGETHTVTSNEVVSIESGSDFVFGSNGDTSSNGGVDVDYVYSDFTMSNEVDDIVLSLNGVTLDTVSWDDGLTMPDPDGASTLLDPWGYTNGGSESSSEYWCEATLSWDGGDYGSPGEVNEWCASIDHDFDGMTIGEGDCDDTDADVYQDAPEIDATKDNDCDGDIELMPVAVATYDTNTSSLEHCDSIYLDGSGSYDPDNSPTGNLTYSWELAAAPNASALTTADISSPTDTSPTFIPDVSGSYTFVLTVNDGGTNSYPVTLSVAVTSRQTNSAPIADAGSDQTSSESVSCQTQDYGATWTCTDCSDNSFNLDSSGSTDADSDEYKYSWVITNGSSVATLDDATIASPVLTVTGPSATYGTTNTEAVEVELTITDCYGAASAADSVTLSLECTGN